MSNTASNKFAVEIAVDIDQWVANYGTEASEVAADSETYLAHVIEESVKHWMETSGNSGTVKVTHRKR